MTGISAVAPGCDRSVPTAMAQACSINSDCAAPLVCDVGHCVMGCNLSSDASVDAPDSAPIDVASGAAHQTGPDSAPISVVSETDGQSAFDSAPSDVATEGQTTAADGCSSWPTNNGQCDAASCQPVTLALASAPQGVAVDSINVYWTNSTTGEVLSCAKTGCGGQPTVLVSSSTLHPQSIAAANSMVYYFAYKSGNLGSIMSCSARNCNNQPLVLAANQSGALAIVVDATYVYWTEGSGQINKCGLSGCNGGSPIALVTVNTGIQGMSGLAVDGNYAYWSDEIGIVRCPLSGCGNVPVTFLAEFQAYDVQTDGSNLYWTDYNQGFLYSCPTKAGCADPIILVSGLHHPNNLVIDSTYIYWASEDNAILRCGLKGCNNCPTIIASGQMAPAKLAIDDAHIYWANYPASQIGSIMSLAK
jgi:hypothetical protein